MALRSSKFLELLRKTLTRVESQTDLKPDDPALLKFKSALVRSVATMETVAAEKEKEELRDDVTDAGLSKSA